jgi:hypothetical protein
VWVATSTSTRRRFHDAMTRHVCARGALLSIKTSRHSNKGEAISLLSLDVGVPAAAPDTLQQESTTERETSGMAFHQSSVHETLVFFLGRCDNDEAGMLLPLPSLVRNKYYSLNTH